MIAKSFGNIFEGGSTFEDEVFEEVGHTGFTVAFVA